MEEAFCAIIGIVVTIRPGPLPSSFFDPHLVPVVLESKVPLEDLNSVPGQKRYPMKSRLSWQGGSGRVLTLNCAY